MTESRNQTKCEGECCGLCCTRIEGLGVTKGPIEILQNVNIHIHCGELTAIIGPNGGGKSTLLKALLGEVPHSGQLKYLDSKGSRASQPITGYVPQQLSFDTGTPVSVLDLFVACLSKRPAWLLKPFSVRKRAMEGLEKVKAEHLIDRRLGALSGGELQRVLLALALDPVPNLLLLDEPVSGMDQGGLELFYNTVAELRCNYDLSIILVSHDFDLVSRYADRVVLLNKTVIASGTPEQVFSKESTRKAFGITGFFDDSRKDDLSTCCDEACGKAGGARDEACGMAGGVCGEEGVVCGKGSEVCGKAGGKCGKDGEGRHGNA